MVVLRAAGAPKLKNNWPVSPVGFCNINRSRLGLRSAISCDVRPAAIVPAIVVVFSDFMVSEAP